VLIKLFFSNPTTMQHQNNILKTSICSNPSQIHCVPLAAN